MVKVVAEIGINANGSVEIAKKLIDVAADNGIDYVKFQKRTIDLVYSKEELDAPRESPWGTTNRQQKEGLEFGLEQYREIDLHCMRRHVKWFVSPWDPQSIDFIEQNFPNVPYHKVPSALLTDKPYLERLKATGRPIILSTGMSTDHQIKSACLTLDHSLACLMHCTSTYPTKPEEMNISYLRTMDPNDDDNFGNYVYGNEIELGFSNHYSGLLWVPIAITLGAKMLEFHITLDRTMYGSDQAASIEPDGVKKLMEHVRLTQQMLGDGVKRVYPSELPIIKKLRKRQDF